MKRSTKIFIQAALATTFLVFLGSFGFFAFSSYRKSARMGKAKIAVSAGRLSEAKWLLRRILLDDPENEVATRMLYDIAIAEDNPPEAALFCYRAARLNPLDPTLEDKYLHALVRLRDFDSIRTILEIDDRQKRSFSLTAEEAKVEQLMQSGLSALGSNDTTRAEELFVEATNLNYFAAAPFLAQSLLAQDKVTAAIDVYEPYLLRFPTPSIAIRQAELLALCNDDARLARLSNLFPANSENTIAFGCYVDSLRNFIKGDFEALAISLPAARGRVQSPFSALMEIVVDLRGGDDQMVEDAMRRLRAMPPTLDFRKRAADYIRDEISIRLRNGVQPMKVLRLAKLVFEESPDLEIERFVLLARFQMRTLTKREVQDAIQRHPGDKALEKLELWIAQAEAQESEKRAADERELDEKLRAKREEMKKAAEDARAANEAREADRYTKEAEGSGK